MTQLDQQTPAQHRQRYDDLRRQARVRAAAPLASPAPPPLVGVVRREEIPGGWYDSFRVRRGQALRLVNIAGNPGVAVLLWNADDPSERYNLGDTLKLQWTARLGAGRVLFSDMGRVLASITADTCGQHDALLGGAAPPLAEGRTTPTNFRLAAGKLGMGVRDIPPCITFFAGVSVDAQGGLHWRADATQPGDVVNLRAEMNLIVAVSNCPHPLAPPTEPGPIEVVVWTPPAAGADDVCRHFGEEAERGFQNTDAMFA